MQFHEWLKKNFPWLPQPEGSLPITKAIIDGTEIPLPQAQSPPPENMVDLANQLLKGPLKGLETSVTIIPLGILEFQPARPGQCQCFACAVRRATRRAMAARN